MGDEGHGDIPDLLHLCQVFLLRIIRKLQQLHSSSLPDCCHVCCPCHHRQMPSETFRKAKSQWRSGSHTLRSSSCLYWSYINVILWCQCQHFHIVGLEKHFPHSNSSVPLKLTTSPALLNKGFLLGVKIDIVEVRRMDFHRLYKRKFCVA